MNELQHDDGTRKYVTLGEYLRKRKRCLACNGTGRDFAKSKYMDILGPQGGKWSKEAYPGYKGYLAAYFCQSWAVICSRIRLNRLLSDLIFILI